MPAQLMKNVFSRESQFWPGYAATYNEGGLGHLSDLGADTVLLWNPSFFTQFCPLVLDTTICQRGFGNLDISYQEMLRGALVQNVTAAYPECHLGIDLRQANFSISIFARSLLANCEQVGRILYNTTRKTAGEVASYEDLWRFTLVNYNAGPGCLVDAVERTHAMQLPMTWESISQKLEPGVCQMSIDYVEDIAFMPDVIPGTISPTVTPTPITPVQPTPLPPQEEETTQQATPAPEEHGYPPPGETDPGPYP